MDQSLEKNLLRHIIKDSNKALIAAERLPNEAFVWSTSRTLYRVLVWSVRTYGTSPNATEVQAILTQQNIQEELASSVLVLWNELAIETPDDSSIEFLIDTMLAYHKRNLTEQALRRSVESLSNNQTDQAIEELKNSLNRIESKFRTEVARSGQLDEFGERIHFEYEDRKAHPEKYEGLKIGYGEIDRLTGGLAPSSVSIIMAPPKEFKSALAMNICYNAAKRGVYSYYMANEGTVELFYMRYAAMELCIPLSHIYSNTMDAVEESRWIQFITSVKEGRHQILNKIYFDEVPAAISTPELIAERLKKLKEDGKKVGLVVVDHFGRMTTSSKEAMQDWQKKGIIAQQICSMALQERIPFILLTHVKAQSAKDALEDNKDFDAYDIERSGQPLKDVDYVFSWRIENREDFDRNGKKGFARLSLMLSRHSETGTATLQINGKYMQIQEIQIGGTSTPTI
jgi:replicative DNA helicase